MQLFVFLAGIYWKLSDVGEELIAIIVIVEDWMGTITIAAANGREESTVIKKILLINWYYSKQFLSMVVVFSVSSIVVFQRNSKDQ